MLWLDLTQLLQHNHHLGIICTFLKMTSFFKMTFMVICSNSACVISWICVHVCACFLNYFFVCMCVTICVCMWAWDHWVLMPDCVRASLPATVSICIHCRAAVPITQLCQPNSDLGHAGHIPATAGLLCPSCHATKDSTVIWHPYLDFFRQLPHPPILPEATCMHARYISFLLLYIQELGFLHTS